MEFFHNFQQQKGQATVFVAFLRVHTKCFNDIVLSRNQQFSTNL